MDRQYFSVKPQDEGLFDINSRQRVLKFILIVSLITFLPLSIKNFVIGETLLACFLVAFELVLLIEIIAVLRLKHSLWRYKPSLFFLSISMVLTVDSFGTLGTYWVFPVVVTVVFLVPRKLALITNGVIIVGSIFTIIPHQEPTVTLRFVLALLFSVSIAHCVVETLRQLQSKLSYLSTRDSLTGALNRHQMEISLQAATRKAALGQQTCIAIIDIDYFKKVNDLHGHDVGDQVIKSVVELVNSNSRQTDLLFRLGGDEFLLLFDNTKQESALTVTQNIRNKTIAGLAIQCPQIAEVTLSIGIAQSIANETSEVWVKRADMALYAAKKAGRNQVKVSVISEYYPDKLVNIQSAAK
ncbi:GGDEF domain-containing protein [Shewanella pneumatophori]|uniref:diguanylate cyclase n=1 Tax=Shewanella pneumatophori TaxID=314092 RepID=A0A9X1Z958_9GAMM|nr:GGDEF domain-containing protein [Shewanella pneumatophori]MCL1137909.1 GGDEF domain-containing protein [Shewanella pneumatophori]